MMAITFTFAGMKHKKGESSLLKLPSSILLYAAFALLIGMLVGAVSALIFYFLIINKLINMKGDLKLSLDSFYKKERDLAGIENPVVIDEELEVSKETVKTEEECEVTGKTAIKTEAKVSATVEV